MKYSLFIKELSRACDKIVEESYNIENDSKIIIKISNDSIKDECKFYLPNEIWEKVFSFFTSKRLCLISFVCKTWKNISYQDRLCNVYKLIIIAYHCILVF